MYDDGFCPGVVVGILLWQEFRAEIHHLKLYNKYGAVWHFRFIAPVLELLKWLCRAVQEAGRLFTMADSIP